jgi:hypothetical protein
MKVQVLDLVEDSTQLEGGLFHFLMSLTQTMNYAHGSLSVSFFNYELDTESELCS